MTLKIPSPPDKEWIEAALRYSKASTTQQLEDASWPFLRANENPGRAASRILGYAYEKLDAEVESLQAELSWHEETKEANTEGLSFLKYMLLLIISLNVVCLIFELLKGGAK